MKSREAEAVSLYDHEPEEEIIPFFFMCVKRYMAGEEDCIITWNEILSNVI